MRVELENLFLFPYLTLKWNFSQQVIKGDNLDKHKLQKTLFCGRSCTQVTNYANHHHGLKPGTGSGLFRLDFYFVVVLLALCPFCSCRGKLRCAIRESTKENAAAGEGPYSRECGFTDFI